MDRFESSVAHACRANELHFGGAEMIAPPSAPGEVDGASPPQPFSERFASDRKRAASKSPPAADNGRDAESRDAARSKRQRVAEACDGYPRKSSGCDGLEPCGLCFSCNRDCVDHQPRPFTDESAEKQQRAARKSPLAAATNDDTASSQSSDARHSERTQVTRPCDECHTWRTRRTRCSGVKPCFFCVTFNVECTFDLPYPTSVPSNEYTRID